MPRKRNPNKFYFTQETEDAIVAYIKSTDDKERNHLFSTYIYQPFLKIAEVVYNKYRIQYIEEQPIDAMHDAVIFMYEQLGKFNQGSGKAFSYFTIVCRNYYIQLSNKSYKTQKKVSKIGDNLEKYDRADDNKRVQEMEDNAVLYYKFLDYLEDYFEDIFYKKGEVVFGNVLLEHLRNIDELEVINRRDILNDLCEKSNSISRTRITKLMNRIEIHYNKFKDNYKKGKPITLFTTKRLTDNQTQYIKDNYKVNCKINGMVALSKKFGVDEEDVRRAYYY